MLKSSDKLKIFRELETIFNIEKFDDLHSLKTKLEKIANDLHLEANKIPRNKCTPSGGMCACSGACIKPGAKALHDAGYELSSIVIELFK